MEIITPVRISAWNGLNRPLMFACFGALTFAIIFHSLTQYINQDEEAFVTPAFLAQNLRIYIDFIYLQSPIYPLVVSKLFILFRESPFLIARLFSAALAIGSVFVFFMLASRFSRNKWFGLLLSCLLASAPLMLLAYGSARNDIMPIFFGLCGVWFAHCGLNAERDKPHGYLAIFWAGFFMAIAVGSKVTAGFIPLSGALYLLWSSRRSLLVLIVGGAIGSLPIVYYAAADFDKFFFCNVELYFSVFKDYYIGNGLSEIFTLAYRIKLILSIAAHEPTLVFAVLFLAFVTFSVLRCDPRLVTVRRHLDPDTTFIFILAITAIPFVFLPVLADKQYLQPAVPYLLLCCAALFPAARKVIKPRQMAALLGIAVLVLGAQLVRFSLETLHRTERSLWTVNQVHKLSELIFRHVKYGRVATLYPALVLDAGNYVEPQFAAGVFFFRLGDYLAPQRVLELNGISPKTLGSVLNGEAPAAVFTGNTPDDVPLLNWALDNCYLEVSLDDWEGGPYPEEYWKPRLFIRPSEPYCHSSEGRQKRKS